MRNTGQSRSSSPTMKRLLEISFVALGTCVSPVSGSSSSASRSSSARGTPAPNAMMCSPARSVDTSPSGASPTTSLTSPSSTFTRNAGAPSSTTNARAPSPSVAATPLERPSSIALAVPAATSK